MAMIMVMMATIMYMIVAIVAAGFEVGIVQRQRHAMRGIPNG